MIKLISNLKAIQLIQLQNKKHCEIEKLNFKIEFTIHN